MTWYTLRVAHGMRHRAQETWQYLWSQLGPGHARPGAAVFGGDARDGTSIFFTPAANRLAIAFGAQPCSRPGAAELKLLAGDPAAWALHFGAGGAPAEGAQGRPCTMRWWLQPA